MKPSEAETLDVETRLWRESRRRELLATREAVPAAERRDADARIAALVEAGFPMLRGLTVGFYWPMKGEVDPRPMAQQLRRHGARMALPVVVARHAPLEFREWHAGVPTTRGPFGLPVPVGMPAVVPDAVFVPPVGFDSNGYRLGYGGGYFDRTLAATRPRPLAIALARECSWIWSIRPRAHDVPMDFVVTEDGIHAVEEGHLRMLVDPAEAEVAARRRLASRRAMPRAEVAELLNTLLESERAGAKALSAFVDAPDLSAPVRTTLRRLQGDEARNCGVLMGLLSHVGHARSGATGPFLQKALAVSGLGPRLELLNRGQAWVERRIREALPRIEDDRVRQALEAMRDSHAENIAVCAALLPVEAA